MWAASLFYLISTIVFFIIFLFVKKDNSTNHSAVAWVVIHAGVLMWINASIAGIYALFNIPFTLISSSIAYIVLSAAGIIYIYKKGVQRLIWHWYDFAAILCIVVVALLIGIRFHTKDLLICDVTGDSCMHFRYAMNVSNTGIVRGEMFFAPVNNGLFISIIKPALSPFQYHKAFFAMGIMMLALSGCVFYAIISDSLKGFISRLFGLVLSLLYMLGYPLNNHLMGFCYLGMSITIVALLMYFLKLYLDNTMHNNWAIYALMLGCFSLVMCYMLFAPVIYFSIFISLGIFSYRNTNLRAFVKTAVKIFLIPCLLGVYYCYFCFFKGRGLSIGDAIKTGGGTRGHFYSHLLILLPATVYFLISDIKKHKHLELTVLMFCVIVFNIVCLLLVFFDKFSIYYYSKLPYLTWFAMSISAYYGLRYMLADDRTTFASCVLIIGCLGLIWLFNFNGALSAKSFEKGYSLFAEYYRTVSFGIYDDNLRLLSTQEPYDLERIDLYKYIAENLENEIVPLLGDLPNYLDVYWCENFTGQDLSDYYYWTGDIEDYIARIAMRKETHYVVLMYNTNIYDRTAFIWNRCDKVYENAAGCILKIT